jgi:CDP-diacylglycerol--serine O-phosphatidyltransferase
MDSQKFRLFSIPNVITCCNLLSGCVGIVFALRGNLPLALTCVLLSAMFDFFDGFFARLLKQYSLVGKQLDSLSDAISFGVLPAAMLFYAMQNALGVADTPFREQSILQLVLQFFPFVLTAFSALRLAKFNVDDRQTDAFLGLPTPACALFVASFAAAYAYYSLPIWLSPVVVVVFSFLLVCEIPMFSLKLKDFSIKKYALQLTFVPFSAGILLVTVGMGRPAMAFLYIILLYIALSILNWLLTPKK